MIKTHDIYGDDQTLSSLQEEFMSDVLKNLISKEYNLHEISRRLNKSTNYILSHTHSNLDPSYYDKLNKNTSLHQSCYPYFEVNPNPTVREIDEIAKCLGCSRRTVQRALSEYREAILNKQD